MFPAGTARDFANPPTVLLYYRCDILGRGAAATESLAFFTR
jgi:hypothetical protein